MTTPKTLSAAELQALAAQLACPHGNAAGAISAEMATGNANMIASTISRLPLCAGDWLLEIGHGGAAHLPSILTRAPDLHYCGLDISEAMDELARTHYGNHPQAAFYLYDGEHFPAFAQPFSHIFSVNTLYFWREPAIFLQKLSALLRPRGTINITYGEKSFMETLPFTRFGFNLYAESDLDALAAQANLTVLEHHYQQENVISRVGTPVERTYCITTLQKADEEKAST